MICRKCQFEELKGTLVAYKLWIFYSFEEANIEQDLQTKLNLKEKNPLSTKEGFKEDEALAIEKKELVDHNYSIEVKIKETTIHHSKDMVTTKVLVKEEVEAKVFEDMTNHKFNAEFEKCLIIMPANVTTKTMKER